MQVLIRIVAHVIIHNNIDAFNINASAKKVGSHKYPLGPFLEQFVTGNALFLLHGAPVDTNRGEIAFVEEFVQLSAAGDTLHKNYNLIKIQCIEKVR